MKNEWNVAEREARIMNSPTPEECYKTGAIHKAYGWGNSPWGHWPDELRAYYTEGYRGLAFTGKKGGKN